MLEYTHDYSSVHAVARFIFIFTSRAMLTLSKKVIFSLVIVLSAIIISLAAFSEAVSEQRLDDWRKLLKNPIGCPETYYDGDGSLFDGDLGDDRVAGRTEDCSICSSAPELCETLG